MSKENLHERAIEILSSIKEKIIPKKEECKENGFFGTGIETIRGIQWDWDNFLTTENFPVSDKLLDWVIGQDHVMRECNLCIDEWVHKLGYLQAEKWYADWLDPYKPKPIGKQKLTPGPYLLLLGEPGTGKSLIGRALAEKMTEVYLANKIMMFDVLCWENKIIPSEPIITIRPAGEGKQSIIQEKKKVEKGSKLKGKLITTLCAFLTAIGLGAIALGFYAIFLAMSEGYAFASAFGGGLPFFIGGGSLLLGGFFIWWITRLGSNFGSGSQGIGGASSSHAPKMLIDNRARIAPFIDATGHSSSQLFGSIAWDPYQTGGLGTPEHQRVTAGDVHRACLGVLYIDEIKNLHPEEAITLLTVLEDGQLTITMRGHLMGGDTSAMAVSTQPLPCMIFLVGAGNFDSIHQIHPALMDRITGYGKVVRMANDMPNTVASRRKYLQFIAQETKRFHMPPFTRDATIELINEGRRKSNKRDGLSTKFRPLISIIKTAGVLAMNEGSKVVEKKYVEEAIRDHCKTIQKQLLEHQVQEQGKLLEIEPKGHKMGTIYGLAVVSDPVSGEMTGSVLRVKGQLIKKKKGTDQGKNLAGYYKVTGIAKDNKWIGDSIDKVRSAILAKYGVDIAQEYFTHIDFSQASGVDGPSAGVTMAILLSSLIEGKPIDQTTAVTGEINVTSTDEIEITAIGGLHEKISAAQQWGFKKVLIPKRNYDHSILPSDYDLEVKGCKTLDDYLAEILVGMDKNGNGKRKD